MRKAVVTLLLVALALTAWGVQARDAQAAAKPLAVVSFSGYDEWKATSTTSANWRTTRAWERIWKAYSSFSPRVGG